MDTDWTWLSDRDCTPGESLLLMGFMVLLVASTQWPLVWDWIRRKVGNGDG